MTDINHFIVVFHYQTGETECSFGTRIQEHHNEVSKMNPNLHAKTLVTGQFKSAIIEHVASKSHVIGWKESKVIDLVSDNTDGYQMAYRSYLDQKEKGLNT